MVQLTWKFVRELERRIFYPFDFFHFFFFVILREIGFSFLRNETIAYRLPGEERLILFHSLNFES